MLPLPSVSEAWFVTNPLGFSWLDGGTIIVCAFICVIEWRLIVLR